MFIMEYISQLVADYSCLSNGSIYIGMGMRPYIHTSIRLLAMKSPNSVAKALLMNESKCCGATTCRVGK